MLTTPTNQDVTEGAGILARSDPNHLDSMEQDNPESPSPQDAEADQIELPERITLKSEVILHRDQGNEAFPYDLVEDPIQNKFYRLGAGEGEFIAAMLAGKSVAESLRPDKDPKEASDPEAVLHDSRLTAEQAQSFIAWLDQSQLLTTSRPQPSAKPWSASLSGLFFYKQSIGNPDAFLGQVHRIAGFLFAWPTSLIIVAGAIISGTLLYAHRAEFLHSYEDLINPWRGMWLLLAWFALKVVHEIGHGATCKRYGGRSPVFGVAFICLMPVAYIDVTSGWLFKSRWKRLHVTLAGVLAELAVATLATVVWFQCESLIIKNAAADIILLASVTTILFNLNPLLRFDGYFALADITNIENLYQHGQTYSRYFGARYLLGVDRDTPELPATWGWLKPYAIAAACWRCVTLFGLLTAASVMFAGAGIALTLGGCVAFILLPLFKLMTFLRTLQKEEGFSWTRLTVRLTTVCLILVATLFVLPADIGRTAPGIVEFDPPSTIRSPAAGFVAEVFVRNGDRLTAGQPILRLENEELILELSTIRTQLEQAKQNARSARWDADSSKLGEFNAELAALQAEEAELSKQVDGLLIKATSDGELIARNVENRIGIFVEEGQELASIGRSSQKRLKISLPVWDANRVAEWSDAPIRISVAGRTSWLESLSRIETRATDRPADPSITAAGGGNLAVLQQDSEEGPVLTEPRVNAFINLDESTSLDLQCGQRCYVRLSGWRRSMATLLYENLILLF